MTQQHQLAACMQSTAIFVNVRWAAEQLITLRCLGVCCRQLIPCIPCMSPNLQVEAPEAKLVANTVFGALRGLETFSQLVDRIDLPPSAWRGSAELAALVDGGVDVQVGVLWVFCTIMQMRSSLMQPTRV